MFDMNAVLKHVRGLSAVRWKHGRETVEAKAREILARGGGLTEKQIAEFVERVDRARSRKIAPRRGSVEEFRALIEANWSKS